MRTLLGQQRSFVTGGIEAITNASSGRITFERANCPLRADAAKPKKSKKIEGRSGRLHLDSIRRILVAANGRRLVVGFGTSLHECGWAATVDVFNYEMK